MKNKKLLILVIVTIVIIVSVTINYIKENKNGKDLEKISNEVYPLNSKNLNDDIVKIEMSILNENSTEGIAYTEPIEIKDSSKIEDILSIINSASLYPDEEFEREYGNGDYFEGCPELILYNTVGKKYTILACDNFDENLNIFYISEVEDLSEKKLYKTSNKFEKKIKELYSENASKISTAQYIDMTEKNYPSNSDKCFEWDWKDVQKNQDDTYTIYGRVYEEQELPQLTAEQYKKLENGEKIEIFNIEMKKDESDEAQYSGYDMILKDSDEISFAYVSKNSDGTADLMYYSEFCIGKATDTYLKITIDKDTPCYVGTTLSDSIDTFENKYNLYMKQNEEYPFDDFNYNEEYKKIVWWGDFIFENEECKAILFTEM